MNAFKSFMKKMPKFDLKVNKNFYSFGKFQSTVVSKNNYNLRNGVNYFENISKHRSLLPVYDLHPKLEYTWIAPNATLIGEVYIGAYSSVWYNSVIRGDINVVRVGAYCSVGEGTVIHTANSLPTGIPASVHIGNHTIIQAGCSLYSCIIENECFIGAKTVIMDGCRVEKAAIITPNSVVPPGRIIPARQVWGGNPVEYIRDATDSEQFANYAQSFVIFDVAKKHLEEFTPWNNSYLQKDSSKDEVDLNTEDLVYSYFKDNTYEWRVKFYNE